MAFDVTDLPIESHLGEVRRALREEGRAVLEAEPGAGKTTIVPLRLLAEGWLGASDKIVVLEPRRVAARAAARRMASLLGEQPGDTVGWVTRDDRQVGPRTRIEVVTDGVLTARLLRDPALSGTGLVVFDEFHERSLAVDTALALTLLGRREHGLTARMLVMSATLDTAEVAAAIGEPGRAAPVITSAGRSHPVDVRWRPRGKRSRLEDAVVAAVTEALTEGGNVLVFLPGVGEIRRAGAALSRAGVDDQAEILELHGSQPAAAQDEALRPTTVRRVVLATDLAETSLTVPGVTVVVDSGLGRRPRFDSRRNMTVLTTVVSSRASADQRAGRAGRTAPGVAIRLWSKMEHATRPAFREVAVETVDLTGLALDLAARNITDPGEVPFVTMPPPRAWQSAREQLTELGAVHDDGSVTALGLAMAELPTHPRLARMIVDSPDPWLGCLAAALLDDRDVLRGRPRELPADLAMRLRFLVDVGADHPDLDGRAVRRARERAHDLARRAGVNPHEIDVDQADLGSVLALGYPSWVARARPGVRGSFVLADGSRARLRSDDPLADAAGLVVCDLGGRRSDLHVERAARLEARLDHLVYATPDLDATVAQIERDWGVVATPGGSHDGLGTRNALLSLGSGAYLEIIGADRDQPDPDRPRPFGVDEVGEPRLVAWALGVPDLDGWLAWSKARGFDAGEALEMSRTTPEGAVLRWRLAFAPDDADGVMPFLIEWPGASPAADAAGGCELLELELRHPDPAIGSRVAEHASVHRVTRGPVRLSAVVFTPGGMVELES